MRRAHGVLCRLRLCLVVLCVRRARASRGSARRMCRVGEENSVWRRNPRTGSKHQKVLENGLWKVTHPPPRHSVSVPSQGMRVHACLCRGDFQSMAWICCTLAGVYRPFKSLAWTFLFRTRKGQLYGSRGILSCLEKEQVARS